MKDAQVDVFASDESCFQNCAGLLQDCAGLLAHY